MINTATGAPQDYAELYVHYFGMIRSIVTKHGIDAGDVEDVSMEILCTFIRRDALSWYDPNKLHDVGPNPKLPGPRLRPAKFQGLLRALVLLYVRQYMDKQLAYARRHPAYARLDAPSESVHGVEMSWGEANAERLGWMDDAGEDRLEMRLLLLGVRVSLKAAALGAETRESQVAAQKSEALDAAIELADSGERVSGAAISRKLGWSSANAVTALRGARDELKAAGL